MTDQAVQTDQAGNGRKILITIVAIPVVILLFSTALYYLANNKMVNLGTVNNGTLISPPLRISELNLQTAEGKPFDYSQRESKWSFVVIGGKDCDQTCERMLYISRQSHHALERRMPRIQRFYLNTGNSTSEGLQQLLDNEYQTTELLYVNRNELEKMISNTQIERLDDNRFYVVDHNGWMMMYYQAENTEQATLNRLGKAVIKDMKRLLK